MKNSLLLFCDAEWVEARKGAIPISFALVPAGIDPFYCEIAEPKRLKLASDFVQEMVIAQFGSWPQTVACSTEAAAASAMVAYLIELLDAQGASGLVLAADFDEDIELLRSVLSSDPGWEQIRGRVEFSNIAAEVFGEGSDDAWDRAYDEAEKRVKLFRHHALVDAIALQIVAGELSSAPPAGD